MNDSILSLKQALIMSMLISLFSNNATAHDLSGSLGQASSAVDFYQIHCFDDGAGANGYLEAELRDETPIAAPLISMQISVGERVYNTTDAKDADAAYSPSLQVAGNADEYYLITINKTAAGKENYAVSYHCLTAENQHTGTEIFRIADQ
ncbi:MAG: hypothetical protein K9K84_01765 [Methylovulum sp.]|jgi:hypothetical protein|nr:hypothetical protein [Methylovulum sp.]